ncbi:hypothetical protein BDW59DRAFT_165543 [Aspergillus cavernicola]|uniref:Uncharacterized protein n=1 Tax=Aspergillus cavernicola TaxID=176166 RepID=A0ABR4HRU6_9EURO
MDILPLCGVHRADAIDRARQDILNQTTLTFLPRRQAQFMEDYESLPGKGKRMSMRDRIKLISDDYRRKFLRRVEIVVQHSSQAELEKVSEFNWEADAWRDIFGRLRDDERLRMDKREYNYTATVLNLANTEDGHDAYMGKRIPDITFGLSSYADGDPEDQGVDERERRIRRSLAEQCLLRTIWAGDGRSIIADGKWGHLTILFPFAVYEAKRNRNWEVEVKMQLKLALDTYLQLLDRVVRRPAQPEMYQSEGSSSFPIFGITSSGSTWRVYVAYLPQCVKDDPTAQDDPLCDEDSHMKLIWWGNIVDRQQAGELLDMVDQIHEYAVTTHRQFVARHLEAWEKLHTSQQQLQLPGRDDILPLSTLEQPGWYTIKSNGQAVRKLLRDKRKVDTLLTDDDVKRAKLESRLRECEAATLRITGSTVRRRGRPRNVGATATRAR